MKNWATQRLGELCDVLDSRRKPITQRDREPGPYPYYGATGILDSVKDYIFDEKLVLIGEDGAKWGANERSAFIAEGRYWVNNHAHVIRPNRKEVIDEWLVYYLNYADLSPFISGLTVPKLNQGQMREIPVPVAPLPEQQRIVTKLDAAFAALAEAQAHVERNRANARELFESYLNGVFEGKGDGWMEYTLPDLSDNLDSRRVPITKSDRKAGPYPYYGASGIVDHVHDFIFDEECLLISEDGANLLMRSTPIAFSVSGKYWVNNHAHILRFRDRATHKLVEHYLESIDLSPWITGAAQPKLNQSAMNSIPIWLPVDLNAREDLVQKLDAIQQETKQLESTYQQKLMELEGLKKGLLGAAFRGEL